MECLKNEKINGKKKEKINLPSIEKVILILVIQRKLEILKIEQIITDFITNLGIK